MPVTFDSVIARDNFTEFYQRYKQKRAPWFRDVNKYENFRYNQHFTEAEAADLLKFRQAPLPIGITAAICDMAESLFTASSPQPRVIPVPYPLEDPRHDIAKSVAYRYDAAIKQTWRESFGNIQFDKVVTDYDNVGHGFHYLVPRNEFGQFQVDYKNLPWHHVYVDYAAKDILYRDSEAIVVSFVMSRNAAWKLAKQVAPELTFNEFEKVWCDAAYLDSPSDYYITRYAAHTYDMTKVVRFIARHCLEEQTVYHLIAKRQDVKLPYKVVREITPEIEKMQKDGDVSVVPTKGFYLTVYTSIGSKGWKQVYPIKNYNIIPAVYDHRGNPFPHGRVWYIYPLQRALNKFISLSILNATLSNSLKFFVEQNSIVDIEKITNYGAIPGVFIQWRRTSPDARGPIPVMPVPLSDAFLQFPRFLVWMMEYVSGITAIMQGQAEDTPSVFSTVAALQNAGGLKIKRRLRNLEVSLSQLGKVIAEMYREYAPPNGNIINVNKNQIETTDYNTLQTVKRPGIAGLVGMTDIEVKPETDLSVGFHDVEFGIESSRGFQAATEAHLLGVMASEMKIPQLVPLILDRLNIPDADKVVEEINQASKLSQQVQHQAEAMKELEKKNQQLTGNVFQLTKELVRSESKGKAGRLLERMRKDLEGAGMDFQQLQSMLPEELGGNNGSGQQI